MTLRYIAMSKKPIYNYSSYDARFARLRLTILAMNS